MNDKDVVLRSTAHKIIVQQHDDADIEHVNSRCTAVHSRYPTEMSEQLHDVVDDASYLTQPVLYRRTAFAGYHTGQCVCVSVCHCDTCRHCSSVNTSLYPMIGSCTTSSCHVDSLPRPQADCSTCCVYEYALDSFQSGLSVDSSETAVDCSTMKGTSMSWSTVHSAPAVLDRLTRYKLPVSHSSLYNCTTIRQAHDRHATHGRVRRDEFCCYHSPFYYTRYHPLAYAHNAAAAAAADAAADDDDDDGRYDKLAPSLRVAKPVLAETQYWV